MNAFEVYRYLSHYDNEQLKGMKVSLEFTFVEDDRKVRTSDSLQAVAPDGKGGLVFRTTI